MGLGLEGVDFAGGTEATSDLQREYADVGPEIQEYSIRANKTRDDVEIIRLIQTAVEYRSSNSKRRADQ